MCGCSSRALVRASRTNRSASPGDGVSPRSRTFTATSWPRVWSRTRNTAANPPSPRTSPTVNFLPRAFWRRRRSVVRSSDMADAKPRKLRRLALGTAGVVLVWLLAVWPPPVWWRDHWPRETAMMREQTVGGAHSASPAVHPSALKDISPVLQRMVRRRRRMAAPRPPPGREHHHPAARQESVSLLVAQSDPQGERGGDRPAARTRAFEGPDSRAVSERRGVGAGNLGSRRGEPRVLRGTGVASHRRAGGRARGHPAASPQLEPDVPSGPHADAPQPDPREVPGRGRIHPAR